MEPLNAVTDETNQLFAVSSTPYNGLKYLSLRNNILNGMKQKVKNR